MITNARIDDCRSEPGDYFSFVVSAWLLILFTSRCFAAEPPITALTFSPDGSHVVAGSQAGMRIFKWPALEIDGEIETDLEHINDVCFSADGTKLAAGGGRPSEFGELEIFAWPDKQRLTSTVEHEDLIYGVDWLSNTKLVTASADTTVASWILSDTGLSLVHRFEGHSRRIRAVAHFSKPNLLVSAGVDQSLRVWNLEDNSSIRVMNNHTDVIHDLARRPGDHALPMVASCSRDGTVRFWQPTIGRLVRFIRLPSEPLSLAWSKSGEVLAVACVDGAVRVVDPRTVRVVHEAKVIDGWAYEVAASPREEDFVVGGQQGQIVSVSFSADAKNGGGH